jgi:hypothetical protein
MLIEIVDVSRSDATGKNGKSYGVLQVAYRADGKMQEKKLMSFGNPTVFKHIEGMSKGDSVNVQTEKDANGYWQWTAIQSGVSTEPSATKSNSSLPQSGATRVTGSNYETAEERAIKQKYIVRQSSLTTAISILSVGAKTLQAHDVIALAEDLEEWVFRKEEVTLPKVEIADIEDDIPY